MTYYEDIYEVAVDNYGLITSTKAKELGISDKEMSALAKRGRTMCELYVLNFIDEYGDVFDVDSFKKHLVRNFARVFGTKLEWDEGFAGSIVYLAKMNSVRIPISSYLIGFIIFRPMNFLHSKLRLISFARKAYFRIKKTTPPDGLLNNL
jgi:hypothetical protein